MRARVLLALVLVLTTVRAAEAGARRSRPTKTGQTLCWDAAGAAATCAGTGQDGDLRRGESRAFQDNGNGTIRDKRTALTWEKLSDDGSIHDKDNVYSWVQAFAKIDDLNTAAFAGATDWRLPNLFELQTLVDVGTAYPAIVAACNTGCSPGCTVLTCSCSSLNYSWTSSTSADDERYKWSVYFGLGSTGANLAQSPFTVRAVRGGS